MQNYAKYLNYTKKIAQIKKKLYLCTLKCKNYEESYRYYA